MVPFYFVVFVLLLKLDKVYVNFQTVELEEHKQILKEFKLFLANYSSWGEVEQDLNFIKDKEKSKSSTLPFAPEEELFIGRHRGKTKHDWTYTGR